MSVAAPKKGAYKECAQPSRRRTICFNYELVIIYCMQTLGWEVYVYTNQNITFITDEKSSVDTLCDKRAC